MSGVLFSQGSDAEGCTRTHRHEGAAIRDGLGARRRSIPAPGYVAGKVAATAIDFDAAVRVALFIDGANLFAPVALSLDIDLGCLPQEFAA